MKSSSSLRLWIGRCAKEAEPWLKVLRDAGMESRAVTLIETRPLVLMPEEKGALRNPSAWSWVFFCSGNAVNIVHKLRGDAPWPKSTGIGAVGSHTAALIRSAGWPVTMTAPSGNSKSLATAFLCHGLVPSEHPILLPGARNGRPELKSALEEAGHLVWKIDLYETASVQGPAPPPDVALLLFSPSAVYSYRRRISHPEERVVWAVGPTTAKAARSAGFQVETVLDQPSPLALKSLISS